MKEFVEKLISRLEEYKYSHLVEHNSEQCLHCQDVGDCEIKDCSLCIWDKSIEIVKQLAEEYNNGWIPCSERLPEEKEQERMVFDPITFAEIDVERYMASDLVNVTVRHYDSDDLFVSDDCTVDGKWVNYDGEEYEVIAWQPLPEPYQPKGE